MRIGWLRHRITIQHQVITQSPVTGEENREWETFKTVWASIEPLKGQEYIEARQEEASLTTRIRIRFTEGVLNTMRVQYKGRIFEIESVVDVYERQRELHLMCEELLSWEE